MVSRASNSRGYLFAALLGALVGGLAVAVAGRVIPNIVSEVMSGMMRNMMACMGQGDLDPEEMCKRMMQGFGEARREAA